MISKLEVHMRTAILIKALEWYLPQFISGVCEVYSRDSPEEMMIQAEGVVNEALNYKDEGMKWYTAWGVAKKEYNRVKLVLWFSQKGVLPYQAIDYIYWTTSTFESELYDIQRGLFNLNFSDIFNGVKTGNSVTMFNGKITFRKTGDRKLSLESIDVSELTQNGCKLHYDSFQSLLESFSTRCQMDLSTVQSIFDGTRLSENNWIRLTQRKINCFSIILLTLLANFNRWWLLYREDALS